ncbi:hypothetical protein ASD64_01435 [Mesorhizobium sp. Root157]|uniref:hypothetical protein n=1 Tax=Mesorhizobium sp. Root157 TaxID=1736477 RepID=UPI0006F56E1B|nr:hypothetical protein [Mesorhizobium sp. Root157]KRA00263.1 hypothetical protein ASD64_01435 [Mesorhizobium sp. Root157]
MAVTAQFLKNIMTEARPIIERQMDDAKIIAGLRTVVANAGGDWGALKALIKAHVEDENDDAGDGKRVQKIRDKADSTSAYADMLGLANMNEKNFSASQSYAEAKGVEPKHRLLYAAKEMRQTVQDLRSTPFDLETGEVLSITDTQEQPVDHPASHTPVPHSPQVDGGQPEPSSDAMPSGQGGVEPDIHRGKSEHQTASAAQDGNSVISASGASATNSEDFDPSKLSFLSDKPRKPLRPHCLNPDLCAGSGTKHCYGCLKARDDALVPA